MESFKVDLIVFGATGLAGTYVLRECAKINSFSWAVAGRSEAKLRELLKSISAEMGVDMTKKDVIVADCSQPESLYQMAEKARVVINCTGPYRFYGENVVKACLDRGTHYVDITGEPEFMEKVQLLYHDLAKAKGCYVVSACGMDSVPMDIGILHFRKNFGGLVNYVEAYFKLTVDSNKHGPILNYATWESAVHGFANQKSLIEIRKKLYRKSKIAKPLPAMPRRPTVHSCPVFENKPSSIPFPGADRLFSLGMFSIEKPAQETLQNTITVFKFYGEGWSEEKLQESCIEAKAVSEPTDSYMITSLEIRDVAYGFTSMCVVQCALLLLNEADQLPSSGGVYTPASAFHRTNIIEILANHGMVFKTECRSKK